MKIMAIFRAEMGQFFISFANLKNIFNIILFYRNKNAI